MTHVCDFSSAWPIGHPLPPVDPTKLRGPEVGTIVRYHDEKYPRWNGLLMRVRERSYVWSPGECRHGGGYRNYDWTVVEWPQFNHNGTVTMTSMVVNDDNLTEV